MPELPEVELVKRDLSSVENLTIDKVTVSDFVKDGHSVNKRTIIKQPVDEFLMQVAGSKILKLGRRGKYLYFILKGEQPFYLVSHLGMSGAYFHVNSLGDIEEVNFKKHWQVIFELSDGTLLVYSDIRRFGEMRCVSSFNAFPPVAKMAPEYTDAGAREYFTEKLGHPKFHNKQIKAAIMESEVIPGVGNIYASESLYNAGILPTRKVRNISDKRLYLLFEAIRDVFETSLSHGGATISDYRSVSGGQGGMQHRFNIYGLKECPEGHAVKTRIIAARNTFYCTTCQK